MLLSEILVKRRAPTIPSFFRHWRRQPSKCGKIKDNRMPTRLSVRSVKLADLDEILDIERASFGKSAYDRNLFADFTRNCGELFLVANKGSKLLGYSITCIRGERAELISIAVHPRHRERGAASALMAGSVRRLRRRRVARFVLMVKVTNHGAIAFYEKHGFRRYRRAPGYYEDGADGLLYVKVL
jgi:ribosomal-protein-alanine N-acetyltransferase